MKNPEVKAKVRNDGALVVRLDDPPGCLQVLGQKVKIVISYVFAFGLGVLFGIALEVFGK